MNKKEECEKLRGEIIRFKERCDQYLKWLNDNTDSACFNEMSRHYNDICFKLQTTRERLKSISSDNNKYTAWQKPFEHKYIF